MPGRAVVWAGFAVVTAVVTAALSGAVGDAFGFLALPDRPVTPVALRAFLVGLALFFVVAATTVV
jgi:hypothetical protein